jgi:hypothetical protein
MQGERGRENIILWGVVQRKFAREASGIDSSASAPKFSTWYTPSGLATF